MSKHEFLYSDIGNENVKEFCYLGIFLSSSANFNNARNHLSEQLLKVFYGVLRKLSFFNLQIVINPILPFSHEMWGYDNLNIIEQVHL